MVGVGDELKILAKYDNISRKLIHLGMRAFPQYMKLTQKHVHDITYSVYSLEHVLSMNLTDDRKFKRMFKQEVSLEAETRSDDDDLFDDYEDRNRHTPKPLKLQVIEKVFIPFWENEIFEERRPIRWKNWYDLELLDEIAIKEMREGVYYIVTEEFPLEYQRETRKRLREREKKGRIQAKKIKKEEEREENLLRVKDKLARRNIVRRKARGTLKGGQHRRSSLRRV